MQKYQKWIPTAVSALVTLAVVFGAPQWIAAHPQAAAILAGVYTIAKGLVVGATSSGPPSTSVPSAVVAAVVAATAPAPVAASSPAPTSPAAPSA